jgi:cell division protein ZapA
MANVVVSVADRPYTMQCPDGEEDHLRELASLLDAEIVRIKQSVGSIGDIRLLVMSGLMVADRLSEAIRKIEALEDQIKGLRESRNHALTQTKDLEAKFTARLEGASERLESIARAMK